jgi:hypothetical protein
MLEDSGHEVGTFDDDPSAAVAPPVHLDVAGPFNITVHAGDAEAAFDADLAAPAPAHPGVDDGDRTRADVGHDDSTRHTDLRRRQSDAVRPPHAGEHVGHQTANILIDRGQSTATPPQHVRIGIVHGHDAPGATTEFCLRPRAHAPKDLAARGCRGW